MKLKKLLVPLTFVFALAAAPAYAQPGHEGHNHGAGGHAHTVVADLGTTTVAGITLQVSQMSHILQSGEGVFEVCVTNGPKPKAMRMWIGFSSAEGSVKTKAESSSKVYDVHIELPKRLTRNSQLWIDVEPEKGKKQKIAFDVKY